MKMLEELHAEFELLNKMSEEEACSYLNADSKAEAIKVIGEEIAYYENKGNEDFGVCSTYHLDEAFSSWASVNAMFV